MEGRRLERLARGAAVIIEGLLGGAEGMELVEPAVGNSGFNLGPCFTGETFGASPLSFELAD